MQTHRKCSSFSTSPELQSKHTILLSLNLPVSIGNGNMPIVNCAISDLFLLEVQCLT